MSNDVYCRGGLVFLAWCSASPAWAKTTASEVVCSSMPEAAECAGQVVNCNLCHDSTVPPTWNDFGLAVMSALDREKSFEEALPDALAALSTLDSDGDGLSNGLELTLGTQPGDRESYWIEPDPPEGEPNPYYRVGEYDPAFAFRRVFVLYCGRSPTYEELQAFSALSDPDAAHEQLHGALDACLQSNYWSGEALPRLADKRIRPLYAAGPDTDVEYLGAFRISVGDYYYDYRLWSYALTGNRDMRDLLTAQYHVIEDEGGELVRVEGVLPNDDPGALAGGQPLEPERRAGMLTTQWFLVINTMFSSLPRTTAAQAYRAFLGADISSNEGLRPVPGEPADIDDKGVDGEGCVTCHSTLDPLAYAFARYEGIGGFGSYSREGGGPGSSFGTYSPDRPQRRMPGWSDDEQRPTIFGQEVEDLVEWAHIAAESDEFKRNMASVFFEHALNRQPLPNEQAQFQALWRSLPEDGYSANRLIHRLVDSAAFGVP